MYYPIIYHPISPKKNMFTNQQWQLMSTTSGKLRKHKPDQAPRPGSYGLLDPGTSWPWMAMAMDGHRFYTINGDKINNGNTLWE
jgi:hypothetical protein